MRLVTLFNAELSTSNTCCGCRGVAASADASPVLHGTMVACESGILAILHESVFNVIL